jgi:hypothetical protein
MRIVSQNDRSSERDSNPGSPGYESRAIALCQPAQCPHNVCDCELHELQYDPTDLEHLYISDLRTVTTLTSCRCSFGSGDIYSPELSPECTYNLHHVPSVAVPTSRDGLVTLVATTGDI